MNFYQHSPEQINQLADALEDPDLDMNGLGWKAAFHLRELQARIADLEAQLYAIGAGGVGASIQPQAQPDTAPAAWAIFSKDGTAMVMWSRDMPSAKNTAEKLGLPLVPLYTAPQTDRKPLTDEQIIEIADKTQTAEPGTDGYILPISFARAIEQAHGITGGPAMTRDDIIKFARNADVLDFRDSDSDPHVAQMVEFLKRFAELVATAEREACAKVCEARHANGNYQHDTRHECAAAIRARGQQ